MTPGIDKEAEILLVKAAEDEAAVSCTASRRSISDSTSSKRLRSS